MREVTREHYASGKIYVHSSAGRVISSCHPCDALPCTWFNPIKNAVGFL